MADQSAPAAPPNAAPIIDATAQLDVAHKAGDGLGYIALVDKLTAEGHAVPYQHRKQADQVRAAIGRTRVGVTVDDRMLHGGLSLADARNQEQGDRLLAAGRTLEQTREILGDPNFKPDNRTAAQRDFDREQGIALTIDKRAYTVSVPPGETAASWQAVDADARSFAADLGFIPAAGSAFITTIIAAGGELAQSADPGMLRQKWEQSLVAVFPGARIAEAERQVDAMLKEYASKSTLAAKLRERGLLRHPELFVRLNNRALSLTRRASTRPK